MTAREPTATIHGFSAPDASPTPWADGLAVLRDAQTYWISTVRPDGRPHVTPLIAVWHDDAIWFSTGADERKARNLALNAACILTTGRSELSGLDVTVEGVAERVADDSVLGTVADAFAAKYGTGVWHFVARDGRFTQPGIDATALVFRVLPARALGFRKGDTPSQTTWRFPPA